MTYWTMLADEAFPEVTLCDHHALEATNIALAMVGHRTYESMSTAALELETEFATFGGNSPIHIGFLETDEGTCGECEAEKIMQMIVDARERS